MCGLAGFITHAGTQANALATAATAMASAIRHRGPDDSGQWVDEAAGIALAHRRLSILDLSVAGHQPMTSADGRYVMVFNGEIYNHLRLRRELDKTGALQLQPGDGKKTDPWRGHADTETLLAAI